MGDTLPPLVEQTLIRHAQTLAVADISLWEAAKLIELGRLQLSVPPAEFASLWLFVSLTIRGNCLPRLLTSA
ncbi:MAG: hypothetical protein BWX48_02943 [Verrucomicrobia bacterium ADurb.Bin006]|nr:type II toxin-antitoxin system VapC family toxin [Verrucomicrobiota bacterium]OQC63969.1 MAG: hypothetical protein BWX48_02943 [Verrucomicrobia bacterium ADurb.Bin006]HOF47799.1 hypothetical protein [Verrucomicrobiota bacterium]HOU87390.1 hypothetical protein [Verrucomicrobiota bacterium]HPV09996.1 hypothetical protein [Verrucomicrobiota bacterium]